MFTSHKQLVRKSGSKGVDRLEFLQELVNEFYQSTSLESQEQVLANLANFAYDPLNYHYLRELKVIELFINGLESRNQFFVEYCMKGLCNLSSDPTNQQIIVEKGGLILIKNLVNSENPNFAKLSLATLTFLCSSPYSSEIKTLELKNNIQKILQQSDNTSIKNYAAILLEEFGETYQGDLQNVSQEFC